MYHCRVWHFSLLVFFVSFLCSFIPDLAKCTLSKREGSEGSDFRELALLRWLAHHSFY